MNRTVLSLMTLLIFHFTLSATTLPVGMAYAYKTITDAAKVAKPGDSIVCHDEIMTGGMAIANLNGSAGKYIYLIPATGKKTVIRGGGNSIQFSDCSYLHIEGLTFEKQTGNGMNIDDGGSFESPAHHIRIIDCTFQDINATGNNDLLKLSGLDDFEIRSCQFLNGAAGGSGIDMVGCHNGVIANNSFKNQGSNSIQAKGGTADILITANRFENGGARAINLGGSTGLAFFRPQNATSEASRLRVIANVFQGSEAPIAFVGCREVSVSNNTILFPTKWVMRILQETVDITRFLPCGDNHFFNNIIVVNQAVNTEVNIGPNTAPQTFTFSNNLWYKAINASWQGPALPGTVINQLVGDPGLMAGTLYKLDETSPAIGAGQPYNSLTEDIEGNWYNNPPSIGAFEARPWLTDTKEEISTMVVYPNPTMEHVYCLFQDADEKTVSLVSNNGNTLFFKHTNDNRIEIDLSSLPSGLYHIMVTRHGKSTWSSVVKW
ncbi:MAG: right-handed parallel beta-helix repeat-containing protein [Saprospiraceae bacterium]|nr:right-handed parallel beta-helix repeat-containing protein [Saprospiraceae bacterium]